MRLYYGRQESVFAASSERTAELAKAAGLDVEAASVAGDHFSSLFPAMQQAVAFIGQRK